MSDKFKELVHYLCSKVEDDPSRLGKVQLNKILWYVDVQAFRASGRTLSNSRYSKGEYGPVAKSLPPVLIILEQEDRLKIRQKVFPSGKYQHEFLAFGSTNLADFSADEIALIDRTTDWVLRHSGKAISDLSHDIVWQMHQLGDEIPMYRSHLLGGLGEIYKEDIDWALER